MRSIFACLVSRFCRNRASVYQTRFATWDEDPFMFKLKPSFLHIFATFTGSKREMKRKLWDFGAAKKHMTDGRLEPAVSTGESDAVTAARASHPVELLVPTGKDVKSEH